MDALDNVCSAADSGGNFRAIAAEEIAYLKGTPAPAPMPTATLTPTYAITQGIVYMINTMSHLVHYTNGCENTVAVDIESSGGSFYPLPGYTPAPNPSTGIPIREESTAIRFLVPDPTTLVPDRMQAFYFSIGGTNNPSSCTSVPGCEVPYFFEETLVPQGPEKTVGQFEWNGTTQTIGDGCPAKDGDTGGAVDLTVDCISGDDQGAAILLQEYQHLYINGKDYGPAAVLLNTASATSVTISSSWFVCITCSPLGSFHYVLALRGGEMQSVLYGSGSILLPCTNPTYCTGDNTVSGNTSSSLPSSIGPHTGLILMGSNT